MTKLNIDMIWILTAVFAAAFLLRMLPQLFAGHGAGVDHWFWKAYIERYRSEREFPPVLPQFLLDEHQWYPPVFPLLMAQLPAAALDRYSRLVAVLIELLRMALVVVSVHLLTGRATSTLAAAVVYALTPILISYNMQLNPRALGALLLDLVIVLLIFAIWREGPPWMWGAIGLLSGLILLTHKMTTQLFWFLCLAAGSLSRDWRLIMMIPGSICMALVLSRGFYCKVLRAHWDIVTFWSRNWPWLNAHPIHESPVYRTAQRPTRAYFRSGWEGGLKRMLYVVGFNPWAWALLAAALWAYGPGTHLTPEDLWTVRWLALILSFVLLTTFVPALRCLGNGYLYVYNSSFPAALVVGMIWGGQKHDGVINAILGITFVLCCFGIVCYLVVLSRSRTLKVDTFMNRALERLRELPDGVVMCLPQHWHDVVAYKAGKTVLFGGHGYGFRHLEEVFPRLGAPVGELVEKYRVSYLLTYEGYLPPHFLDELPFSAVEEIGSYRLFHLDHGRGASAKA